MISKICVGHSFYGSIRYICHELKKAEILAVEGVRCHDQKLMIQDFERQHGLRPEKNQACFHGILSFYPGEKPSDKTIAEIAGKYLEGLNIRNTQFAIVKHKDKAHLHVHLIANMVDNDGKSIPDNWIALRAKKQAQKLTLEYKLEQGLSKTLSLTHYQSLREPEQHLYKIYAAVRQNLRTSRSLDELEQKLSSLGIEMQYKYKGQTNVKQGVSFRLGEYCFKGSQIDRQFSFPNLEKVISLQQRQSLLKAYPEKPLAGFSGYANSNLQKNKGLARTVTQEMHKFLELLLKQEQAIEQIPYELTQEAKRKRHRQRQSPH
jgi:Relaxase/Mobilisation nuclease domain